MNVPAVDSVRSFHALHGKRYGYADETRMVEAVNLRVRFTVEAEPWELPVQVIRHGDGEQARIKMAHVYFGEEVFGDARVCA